MGKKLTYKEVTDFLGNLNYKLISDEFISTRGKIIISDINGYYYLYTIERLKFNEIPSRFHISNPYTIQNINLWCKLNNKPFELVAENYEKASKKLKWKCLNCGDYFLLALSLITNGIGCGVCHGSQVGLSNCLATKNPELAKDWHPTKNGELTPYDITVNSHKKVWWLCKENSKHEWCLSPNERNRNGCPYCAGFYASDDYNLLVNNPKLCEEWNHKKNDNKPEEYTPSSNKKVWWECKECGYEWFTSINCRASGSGCPECNESKGEIRIREWLRKYSVIYSPQKVFDGLLGIGEGLLSYDFFLPNFNLLIEYQGEQHERFIKGLQKSKRDFEKQQEHDRRKKEYSKNNNVELLEIWYYDYNNIEEILSEKLQSKYGLKEGDNI